MRMISIIVPTHNQSEYIFTLLTLDKKSQTYENGSVL
jgi:hypothetical protein